MSTQNTSTQGVSRSLSIPEPDVRVLNLQKKNRIKIQSAVEASKELQKLMLRMKGEVIAEDGSGVKYSELKSSSLFQQYKSQAAGLQYLDLTTLSEKEKTAFFINIYNALTIHGLAECETLPESVLKVQMFWKVTSYNIGGHVFSLDDIEHGILRGNRPHPASRNPPFSETDKRRQYCVQKLDPRIHFALVCGAKSCPVINVYSAENLDSALEAATRNFCEQEVKPYEIQRELHVSRVFQWYVRDFGQNDLEAIRWSLPYLTEAKRKSVEKLLYMIDKEGMVDLKYREYNWALNNIAPPPVHLPDPALHIPPPVQSGKS